MKTFHSDQTKRTNANKTRERTQSWRYVARDAVYLHGQNRNNRMGSILLWAKECRLTEMREHLIRQHVFHHASLQTTDQPTVDTLHSHFYICWPPFTAGGTRDGSGVTTAIRVANNQPQFESHHWIRFRTPETELGVFYGDLGTFPAVFLATETIIFFLEVGPSPSVFVATVTGF